MRPYIYKIVKIAESCKLCKTGVRCQVLVDKFGYLVAVEIHTHLLHNFNNIRKVVIVVKIGKVATIARFPANLYRLYP